MDSTIVHQATVPPNPPVQAIAVPGGEAPHQFPPNIPLINLREGSKAPASAHGHHDAVPQDEFVRTGTNVGMVLDKGFLAVDIDHEENDAARDLSLRVREMGPWEQKTPRGRHFLFRSPPEWSGTNATLRDKTGKPFGDIKCSGYIVGPGSVVNGVPYRVENGAEPPLAPQWLLELATRPPRAESVEERGGIPYGEHDAFLVRLAGYLRGREALTEKAILGVLEAGPLGVLDSIDESRPFTERDLRRIARSATRWEARHEEDLDLTHPGIRSATAIELVGPPIEWIVRGFIPCGELVLMYGPGGIGKSSMGSWLAAEVNRQGKRFAYMGTEEPPARFYGRAILSGAKRDQCFDVVNPGKLRFPRDAALVRAIITESRLDVLYIDSIYSHFERKEGDNAAERARDALAPLLAISHETGCTIFGVFHTNKAGAFLGSTEMENVARCLLEAKRKPKQTYLGVKVHKTNLYHPGKMMRLEGHEEIFRDESGNVQLEVNEHGEEVPLKIVVPTRIEDVDDDEESPDEAPIEFEQSSLSSTKDTIRECMERHPDWTNEEIAEYVGKSLGYVGKVAWGIRNEKIG